jgi:hypothetical protein
MREEVGSQKLEDGILELEKCHGKIGGLDSLLSSVFCLLSFHFTLQPSSLKPEYTEALLPIG